MGKLLFVSAHGTFRTLQGEGRAQTFSAKNGGASCHIINERPAEFVSCSRSCIITLEIQGSWQRDATVERVGHAGLGETHGATKGGGRTLTDSTLSVSGTARSVRRACRPGTPGTAQTLLQKYTVNGGGRPLTRTSVYWHSTVCSDCVINAGG